MCERRQYATFRLICLPPTSSSTATSQCDCHSALASILWLPPSYLHLLYEIGVDIHITVVFQMWPLRWLVSNSFSPWSLAIRMRRTLYSHMQAFLMPEARKHGWGEDNLLSGEVLWAELSAVVRPNDKIEWMWRCGTIRDNTWMCTKKMEANDEHPFYTGCLSVYLWYFGTCLGALGHAKNTHTHMQRWNGRHSFVCGLVN